MTAPLVYIVVLSWNRCATVLECLANLRQTAYARYVVVVVDNNSTDDSVDKIRTLHPEVHLILNERNLGYAGGANRGIEYALTAAADYIWLLNDDTSVPAITLQQLVECAEEDPTIAAVAPLSYYQDEPDRLQFAGGYVDISRGTLRSTRNPDEANRAHPTERQVLVGAAMLLRAEAVRRTGVLDERLFAYWEDFDLSLRFISCGMKTYVLPSSRIYHSTTMQGVAGRSRPPYYYYLMIRNEFWFWRRHLLGTGKSILRSFSCVGAAVAEAAVCRHRGFHACADACLDGVWSAFLAVPGSYEERRQMPQLLRKVLSWRPYFWSALLSGNWRILLRRVGRLR